MKTEKKPEYNKVTIEAAVNGWIVTEKGQPAKVLTRWDRVTNHLQDRLTTGPTFYEQ